MQAYYGQKPKWSYFVGCSEGGHEAAMESQRYPEDFNGILCGCPAMNFLTLGTIPSTWGGRVDTDANGHRILTPDKLPILHAAALAACDAQDGLKDGLISEPDSCHFDPAVTECRAVQDPKTCLTPSQVQAARLMYQGASDAKGRHLVISGPPPGSELGWFVKIPPESFDFGMIRFLFFAFPQNPPLDSAPADFPLDASTLNKMYAMHTIYDATDPDLSKFAMAGHKIIFWDSLADPLPPLNEIAYYKEVLKLMGVNRTRQFALMYLFPGGGHCNAGITPIVCDLFSAVMGWVEKGVVPNRLTSYYFAPNTVKAGGPADMSKVVRTRPVFPYPQVARYKGNGSIDDAANFEAGMRLTPEDPITWVGTSSFFKPDYEQWCGWTGMSFTCGPERK
jgi:feruloyl esterase